MEHYSSKEMNDWYMYDMDGVYNNHDEQKKATREGRIAFL
jgi:hypothetical protein